MLNLSLPIKKLCTQLNHVLTGLTTSCWHGEMNFIKPVKKNKLLIVLVFCWHSLKLQTRKALALMLALLLLFVHSCQFAFTLISFFHFFFLFLQVAALPYLHWQICHSAFLLSGYMSSHAVLLLFSERKIALWSNIHVDTTLIPPLFCIKKKVCTQTHFFFLYISYRNFVFKNLDTLLNFAVQKYFLNFFFNSSVKIALWYIHH